MENNLIIQNMKNVAKKNKLNSVKDNLNKEKILVTFFMPVTNNDIVIADYSIRSYQKIRHIPFKLVVYANMINGLNKNYYFSRWRKYFFVKIVESKARKIKPNIQGRFESYDSICDRELKKIKTRFYATVDADFEILDGRFVNTMINRLQREPQLKVMSVNYQPKDPNYFDTYTQRIILSNERYDTCFCIYKRETLGCKTSRAYYEENSKDITKVWDSFGRFQMVLKKNGAKLAALGKKFNPYFIHYGAFSNNQDINKQNIKVYRLIKIILKKVNMVVGEDLIASIKKKFYWLPIVKNDNRRLKYINDQKK